MALASAIPHQHRTSIMTIHYPALGSISSGTLRVEDLLDTFADELENLVQRNAETWCSDAGRAERDTFVALVRDAREIDCDGDPDRADELVNALEESLNWFAPDYCYFGTHPGDGAEFGFWLADDWRERMEDNDVLMVDDSGSIPEGYRGAVCVINDHGNVSFYFIDAADVQHEIWSCV